MIASAAALTLTVGVVGLAQLRTLSAQTHRLHDRYYLSQQDVAVVREMVWKARLFSRDATTALDATTEAGYLAQLAATLNALDTAIARYYARDLTPAERTRMQEFAKGWDLYLEERATANAMHEVGALRAWQDYTATVIDPEVAATLKSLDLLTAESTAAAERGLADADRSYRESRDLLIAIVAAAFLLASAMTLVAARAGALARMDKALKISNSGLRASLREQAAVSRLSQRALAEPDPQAVMAQADELLMQVMRVDRVGMFRLQPDASTLLLVSGSGWGAQLGSLGVGVDDPGLIGRALMAREATTTDPQLLPGGGLAAGACVAVLGGGLQLGVVGAFSREPREFTQAELAFLHSVAFIVGSVVYQQQSAKELEQARRLEAVGQLAAGVAHEINTPIQFVADNLRFLDGSLPTVAQMLAGYHSLVDADDSAEREGRIQALRTAEDEFDLDFVRLELPLAASQALEGATRVAEIVHAMKSFSHPGSAPGDLDVNDCLYNALIIASHEIKPWADVTADHGEVPMVRGVESLLNQVFLNILINAAHAVTDVHRRSGRRGVITTSTRVQDDLVVVSIADTGPGIPDEIREHVFEPFFTTKEVGRGTGQGLYLAKNVIDQHHGTIAFGPNPGGGTIFTIRLPVARPTDHAS